MNSKILSAVTLLSCAAFVQAKDTIQLNNGNVLIGDIMPSDDSKVITLKHPAAKQPIKIKGDSVTKISFGTFTMDAGKGHGEGITLSNGDSFPCSVTKIDDTNITFTTSFMGTHTLPRAQVASIRFNSSPENNLYSGPEKGLSGWDQPKSIWTVKDDYMVTTQKGTISREIKNSAQNYTIQFKAKWNNTKPRIKFYFSCTSKDYRDIKKDCYILDINNIGLQINRFQNNRYRPLGQIPLTRDQFSAGEAEILLQVDRKHKKLALYFNGRKLKEFFDTITPPKGNHIIFQTLQDSGGEMQIGEINVNNWSGRVVAKTPNKDKALINNDILTDSDGRPMTGSIKSLTLDAEKSATVLFNIAFAKEPLKLPESKVISLEFKRGKADNAGPAKQSTSQAQLAVGGTLSYDVATFTPKQLTVEHPILGKITIERKHLSEIATIEKVAQK